MSSEDEEHEYRRPFDPVRWGFRLIALAVALIVTAIICSPYIAAKLYNMHRAEEAAAEAKAHPPFVQAYVVTPDGEENANSPGNTGTSQPGETKP